MSYFVEATMSDVKSYNRFGKLQVPLMDVLIRVERGAKLTQECSSFTDPGDDWNKLLLDGKCIGYWEGY